jgi:hypothetical protein
MRRFLVALFLTAIFTISAFGQTQNPPPTLRIVTEDPSLPSELYYGNVKVKPLRLRPGTNQPITIDDSDFFVQQHYIDFLSRFPEESGFQYWTSILNGCASDPNPGCENRVRVEISSRFFIELEFQRTGFFVMRLHQASFGQAPNYTQFIADRKLIQNTTESQRQFANAWVARSAFLSEYPANLSNTDFVTRLFDKAKVTNSSARTSAISALNSGKTRADVIFDLVELPEFQNREYNPTFVRMQYFGYLRRDIDQEGYNFWINVLNNTNNFRSMICAFVNSNEYQLRFQNTRGKYDELDCAW